MSRFARWHLLVASLLLVSAVEAQELATPDQPQPIRVPQIAERAERLDGRLRLTDERVKPDAEVVAVSERLPAVVRDLAQREARLSEAVSSASLDRLVEFERGWQGALDRLSTWTGSLTRRAVELETELDELEGLRDVWTRTRVAAAEAAAPEAVIARAQAVVRALEQARERVSARRAEILTLQNRVSEQEQIARRALASISDARARARSRLFDADARPIWQAVAREPSGLSVAERVRQVATTALERLEDYFAHRPLAPLAHVAVIVGILAFMFGLRPRARRWAERDEGFRIAARLFERPIATGLLLGLLAWPWIYPAAPGVLDDLFGLLLLVPILRLLPMLLPESLRPAVRALAAFYVVDRLRELLASAVLLERVVFLAEIGVALLGLVWLIRPARLERVREVGPWLRALGTTARGAVLLLGACLILNVLGYAALSHLLGDGVLRSAYLAVALYAGVVVLDGVLRALLRMRPLRLLNVVVRYRASIVRRLRFVSRGLALLVWTLGSARLFAVDEIGRNALYGALTAELTAGNLSISAGDVLTFVLTVLASLWLARTLRTLFETDLVPRVDLPRGVGYAGAATLQYVVVLLGFFLALGAAGIDMDRFALVAGAFGVGIGFGLQNVVNNFVSGIILLFERPVQVGDVIEAGELMGEVKRIGIRSSTIRTWQGAEVIVPNSNLISDRVVNWTMSDRHRRIEVPVGVEYGTSPERVIELLTEVARAHPEVLREPAPVTLFRAFGDSSLNFEVRAWTSRFEQYVRIQSELAVAVNAALDEAGITIPFPQRDLHLKSVDPAARSDENEAT